MQLETFTREKRAHNYELNLSESDNQLEVLESFPVNVIIPTGMRCNFKCIFCTDRSKKCMSDYADLSFKQFVRFTEPLHGAFAVGLYGWGEPLINPDYYDMFDYVTKNFGGIQIHVTSNGSLMSSEWARRLASYKWSVLAISLNAAKSSTHKILTGSSQFNLILNNIRNIVALRQATGGDSPYIILSFVSMVQNIRELPDFVDMAVDLGADHVLIQDLMILREEHERHSLFFKQDLARRMYLKAKERVGKYPINFTVFSPVSYFPQGKGQCEDKDQKSTFCRDPWESFKISHNGDVFLCCYSSVVMGHMLNQTFEEIWNGDNYRYYRRHVNGDNPPEECKVCSKKAVFEHLELHKWHGVQY